MLKKVLSKVQVVYDELTQAQSWVLLLLRICIGFLFFQIGLGKLTHFENTVSFFTLLGIPAPALNAAMASTIECLGGVFLMLGLFTRIVSVKLVVVMIVAIVTAQLPEVHGAFDLIALQETDYLLFFLLFVFTGPGKWSLDAVLKKYVK